MCRKWIHYNSIILHIRGVGNGHIAKALEEISAADPNTALTQNQLRKLVKSGAIPCVHVGRHTLVNLDTLIAYLASDEYQLGKPAKPAREYGKIRRIAE